MSPFSDQMQLSPPRSEHALAFATRQNLPKYKPASHESKVPVALASTHLRGENQTKKRRSVQFQSTCSMKLIASHDEYTDDEFSACWYDDDECRQMMADNVETVREYRGRLSRAAGMSGGIREMNAKYDVRGLEAMLSPEALAERQSNRARCINSVLDEQDRRWCNPEASRDDGESIGAASARASASAMRRALQQAVADAICVRSEAARARCLESSRWGALPVDRKQSLTSVLPKKTERAMRSQSQRMARRQLLHSQR